MLAHMSFCHILGTKILIIIIHNSFSNFRPKDNNLRFKCNNLRLRVSSFKYKTLRLKSKDNRGNKLLA